MTNCLLKEEVISIVSAVLDNEWLLTNHCPCTHTFRHIHTLLSRKVPKVKLGKVQSFVDCAVESCHVNMHCAHTHIYTVWLSLWVCLVIAYHLPRQQCMSIVFSHFSFGLKQSCISFQSRSKSSHKKDFTPMSTRDQQVSRLLCACDLTERSALSEKMHVIVRANP